MKQLTLTGFVAKRARPQAAHPSDATPEVDGESAAAAAAGEAGPAPGKGDVAKDDGGGLRENSGQEARPADDKVVKECSTKEVEVEVDGLPAEGDTNDEAPGKVRVGEIREDDDDDDDVDKEDDHDDDEVPNDYEARRLAKIRENNAFLESLGLHTPVTPASRKPARKTPARGKRPRPAETQLARGSRLPTRRSRRLAELDNPESKDQLAKANIASFNQEAAAPDPVYAASGVSAAPLAIPDTALVSWQDSSLKRIYCLDAHPSRALVAAAGHGGRIAIFAPHLDDPLLSFKGFHGWCSSVQFVGDETLLLGASNDGALDLFDTSLVEESSGRPRIVARAPSGLHASGIFAMHAIGTVAATASKDASVAICKITNDSQLACVARFNDLHSGVIKSVRLRDEHTFASTGNDACVRIGDLRTNNIVATIGDVHAHAANSVRWRNEYQLMTTSFDPEMRLFDIRAPRDAAPLAEFHGHVPRAKTIYHPLFSHDGTRVTVCGDHRLTTFDVDSKAIVWTGGLDFSPTALCANHLDRPNSLYIGGPQTVVSIEAGLSVSVPAA